MSSSSRPRLLLLTLGMGVGGAEEMIRQSLPLLEAEGFQVTLWTLMRGGVLLEEIRRAGGSAEQLGSGEGVTPAKILRLWRGLRRHQFDLIHSHLFGANLVARVLGKMAGVPVILNSHHGTDAWRRSSWRLLERETASWADRILTCSEAVRRTAVEEVGLPEHLVVTVTNGICWERYARTERRAAVRAHLGLHPRQLAVGYVGRLEEPTKGGAVLIEALERIASLLPEVIGLVIGDGPSRSRLETEVHRRHLDSRVRFLGERRDVPDLLQALDLYVQPSLFEGFGLAVVEAMAAGLPVVATRVGGLPEVLEEGETGDLVPPGDPDALAEKMARLLRSESLRLSYGSKGRERVRSRFPLEGMVRGWTRIYREQLAMKGWRQAA